MKTSVRHHALKFALLAATLTLSNHAFALTSNSAPSASDLPMELGKPEEDDLQIDIVKFIVNGLEPVEAESLHHVTAPYIGQQKGYEDLMNAAAAVTRHMQTELGYYVGFAYIPAQDTTNGVVYLQALPGRLDQVEIVVPQGETGDAHHEVIKQHLASLKPNEVLKTKSLERKVLLLNDLPGMNVRVELEEGRSVGTVKLKVISTASASQGLNVNLDSHGNKVTGRYRLGLDATTHRVLKTGDALRGEVLVSHNARFRQATLGYVAPVGTSGLKAGVTVSRIEYDMAQRLQPADLSGSGSVANAYAVYPLIRSRDANWFGLLSHEQKRFANKVDESAEHKSADAWVAAMLGDSRDNWLGGGINTYEIQSIWGHLGAEVRSIDPDVDRNFHKMTWNLARLQNIVPNRLQLYTRFQGQASHAELDTTEHFTLGGPTGVRAFESTVGSGDEGMTLSAELRWLPPASLLGEHAREFMFSVFYDWGRAKIGHDAPYDWNTYQYQDRITLNGYGIGMIWERPNDITARLDLAWKGHTNTPYAIQTHQPRVNIWLSKRF